MKLLDIFLGLYFWNKAQFVFSTKFAIYPMTDNKSLNLKQFEPLLIYWLEFLLCLKKWLKLHFYQQKAYAKHFLI